MKMEFDLLRILDSIGISLPSAVSGFLGGVVRAFVAGDSRPWAVVGFVVIGAITANYITELLARYLGFPPGAAGFFVGFTATVLLQKMMTAAERFDPFRKSEGEK